MKNSKTLKNKKSKANNMTSKVQNEVKLVIGEEIIDVKIKTGLIVSAAEIRVRRSEVVELALAKEEDLPEGLKFLEQKKQWIKEELADIRKLKLMALEQGVPEKLLIFAKHYNVALNAREIGEAIEITSNRILISHMIKDPQDIFYVITIYLQSLIKSEAIICANYFAQKLDIVYGEILLDESAKAIKCFKTKNLDLYLSWRLVFAPKYVLYGLIAKELLEIFRFRLRGFIGQNMNHSNLNVAEINKLHNLAKIWLNKNEKSISKIFAGTTGKVIRMNEEHRVGGYTT